MSLPKISYIIHIEQRAVRVDLAEGQLLANKPHQSDRVAPLLQQVCRCFKERLGQGLLTQPAARGAEASKTGVGHMFSLEVRTTIRRDLIQISLANKTTIFKGRTTRQSLQSVRPIVS